MRSTNTTSSRSTGTFVTKYSVYNGYYVKLIGRNNTTLELWTHDTLQESLDRYFKTKEMLGNYAHWSLECDSKTTDQINIIENL